MMTRPRARLRTARRRSRTGTPRVAVDVAAEVAAAADVKTTLRLRTASSRRRLPPLPCLPRRAPLLPRAMTMLRVLAWRTATVVPPADPRPVAVVADATTVAAAEVARAVVVAVTSANLASRVRLAHRGSRCH